MKKPEQLSNLADAYKYVRNFKRKLLSLCADAFNHKDSDKMIIKYEIFKYRNKEYYLEIFRGEDTSSPYWLRFGDEFDIENPLDWLKLDNFYDIRQEYEYFLGLIEDRVSKESEALTKLDSNKTSEAIYQQISGFRG